ncbi:MAG: SDR family oxidoreductase [Bacteroidota bacterium]
MSYFQDKVIIITGSSMGIGKVMANKMAQAGAKIVLNGRNKERLRKTQEDFRDKGFDMLAIDGDVSKVADCQRLIDETVAAHGKVDVLINNAGISMEGTVSELQPDIFKKVMDVNFLGSVYPTQAALPHLRKSKGHVIFIGSAAGIRGLPRYAAYSASKMALTALAESLRMEEARHGLHVGLAYVGFTENDPDKTIYDKDGNIIPQPKRDFIKAEPPENVARRIMTMIESRRFKQVFTILGQLNAWVNRWIPSVGEWVLARNYKKNFLSAEEPGR